MVWTIELTAHAEKLLSKLDKPVSRRITEFLKQRVATLDNPRNIGEALKGSELGEFWKYRVGDYRLICEIQNDVLRVIVVKVGNRREVYS